MKKVHVIAHTHWDYEWYFTRQHARVQFAYHLNEVLKALEENKLDYYLLDGQMAIVEDYLETNPDKKTTIEKFVRERRLFVGPWFTQIDELLSPGESIVRNLQLGIREADKLGGAMKIGYLPDSFGQGQDMPKIYQGFGIENAVFWRGMPKEKNARYFYWTSDDKSKVLVAEIKNSYAMGSQLIENEDYPKLLHQISSDTKLDDLVYPAGGDQRPVDFNLKDRINYINGIQKDYRLVEDNYPSYFEQIANSNLPEYTGEFIDPSSSKIHRGIYSSRADIKYLYNKLEDEMINEIEPLMAIAKYHGIETETGMLDMIWKTICRGMAHDSSGGCNSDLTNQDIKQRGKIALQLADALKYYILRKLSSNSDNGDLFFWNVKPQKMSEVVKVILSTKSKYFKLLNSTGKYVDFDVLGQEKVNAAELRKNKAEMKQDIYYRTTIAVLVEVDALDWTSYQIKESGSFSIEFIDSKTIENNNYSLSFSNGKIGLLDKRSKRKYENILQLEDGGDEGDGYDYSPAYEDWIIDLDFKDADVKAYKGKIYSKLIIKGTWILPKDLKARSEKARNQKEKYCLTLILKANSPVIELNFDIDNEVKDHRLRLIVNTNVKATYSYADTAFGYIKRPVIDKHLYDWKEIGYHEEPTAIRPLLHFVNSHDKQSSWSVLSNGQKAYQLIGKKFQQIAITLFRCVGFLGRPDMIRRPGDASGLINKWVPTPDSQLQGMQHISCGLVVNTKFDPANLQNLRSQMVSPFLWFQEQKIDEYTNPLQHFWINENSELLTHKKLFNLTCDELVVSSLYTSNDNTGLVLRIYNPNKYTLKKAGRLNFKSIVNVLKMDLNNKVEKTLAVDANSFELYNFRPGEIRSYGIFLKK